MKAADNRTDSVTSPGNCFLYYKLFGIDALRSICNGNERKDEADPSVRRAVTRPAAD